MVEAPVVHSNHSTDISHYLNLPFIASSIRALATRTGKRPEGTISVTIIRRTMANAKENNNTFEENDLFREWFVRDLFASSKLTSCLIFYFFVNNQLSIVFMSRRLYCDTPKTDETRLWYQNQLES